MSVFPHLFVKVGVRPRADVAWSPGLSWGEPWSPGPQAFPSGMLVCGPVMVHARPWVLGRPGRGCQGPSKKAKVTGPRPPALAGGSCALPSSSLRKGKEGTSLAMDEAPP